MYSGLHALPNLFLKFFNPGGFMLFQDKNHRLPSDTFTFSFPHTFAFTLGISWLPGAFGHMVVLLFCLTLSLDTRRHQL